MELYNQIVSRRTTSCLNPYYNGRYSWRAGSQRLSGTAIPKSLNPYYNGRYSWRELSLAKCTLTSTS